MTPATIAAKLKKKGQPMTLTRTVAGTFDPVTGGMTGATTQANTVYGITINYRDGIKNQPGTLIQTGDKKVMINAGTVTPVPGDTLTIAGVVWQIIAADALDTAGTALYFNCQVRK